MKSTAEEHMKIILDKLRGSEVGNKNHNKSKQKDLTISKNADIQKDDSFSPNHTEKVKNSFEDKRAASNNDLEQWLDDILDD
ncbi:unnamed protein product [Callosobruchus maculatus]|nr:unnamed protein product [Callosobruchus maculatus]